MTFTTSQDALLWMSLWTILIAALAAALLPQNGPMRIQLNRKRIVLFAEGSGVALLVLYIMTIAGLLR